MTKFYNVTAFTFSNYICAKLRENDCFNDGIGSDVRSLIQELNIYLENIYIPRILNNNRLSDLKSDSNWLENLFYLKRPERVEERVRIPKYKQSMSYE